MNSECNFWSGIIIGSLLRTGNAVVLSEQMEIYAHSVLHDILGNDYLVW